MSTDCTDLGYHLLMNEQSPQYTRGSHTSVMEQIDLNQFIRDGSKDSRGSPEGETLDNRVPSAASAQTVFDSMLDSSKGVNPSRIPESSQPSRERDSKSRPRGRRKNSDYAGLYPTIYHSVDEHGKPRSNIFRHHLDGGNVARKLLKDANRRRNILASQRQEGVSDGVSNLRQTDEYDRFFIYSDLPEVSRRLAVLDAECKAYVASSLPKRNQSSIESPLPKPAPIRQDIVIWSDDGVFFYDYVRLSSDSTIKFKSRAAKSKK